VRESSYRLASFTTAHGSQAGAVRAGIVIDERIVGLDAVLGGAAGSDSVASALAHWAQVGPQLGEAARAVRSGRAEFPCESLGRVRLLAPIARPGVIFCAGANYHDHVAAMTKALGLPPEPDPHAAGLKPWHFIKASASCVRGPGPIELPTYSTRVDWEAEIAIVIGRKCRNVSEAHALEYVAGLSIVNDLSARDHLRRSGVAVESPFRYDWVSQKCFEGALPFGPWICPLEEIPDIGALGIRLWVNDVLMQDSSSAHMIFSAAEQIAHLSTRLTLHPGDVIATGTPAGVGAERGVFLKAGDSVRIEVETIGTLTNQFTIAGSPSAEGASPVA